jgi:catechol-2,3-dioxygenase
MSTGPSRPSSGAVVQHLVLRCRDIEKSHTFYTEILGFEQCAALEKEKFPMFDMRFYRGSADHHHDLALSQLLNADANPPEAPWQMLVGRDPGIDHIAICYPSRDAWLDQIKWMKSQGVEFLVRGNHGMTHSAYISDPDGNGIEVLYDVPKEAWQGDVNAALNYFEVLPTDGDEAFEDTTEYVKF